MVIYFVGHSVLLVGGANREVLRVIVPPAILGFCDTPRMAACALVSAFARKPQGFKPCAVIQIAQHCGVGVAGAAHGLKIFHAQVFRGVVLVYVIRVFINIIEYIPFVRAYLKQQIISFRFTTPTPVIICL